MLSGDLDSGVASDDLDQFVGRAVAWLGPPICDARLGPIARHHASAKVKIMGEHHAPICSLESGVRELVAPACFFFFFVCVLSSFTLNEDHAEHQEHGKHN